MNDRAQAIVDPIPIMPVIVGGVVLLVGSKIQSKVGQYATPGTDFCGCGIRFGDALPTAIGVGLLALFGAVLITSIHLRRQAN